jgi:hypothetical protein
MLSKLKMKKFAKENQDIKLVTLESMNGEQCHVKKFTMGDTMTFRTMDESKTLMTMVMVGIVDASGKPLFDLEEEVSEMPVEVVTEMISLVSEHNSGSDVEEQAKKS